MNQTIQDHKKIYFKISVSNSTFNDLFRVTATCFNSISQANRTGAWLKTQNTSPAYPCGEWINFFLILLRVSGAIPR